MPSSLSHPAIPIAIRLATGRSVVSNRLLFVAVLASALPDIDCVGFRFGIRYGSLFGHRGFSHSVLFAASLALLVAPFSIWLRSSRLATFGLIFGSTVSHGILDAMTDGGLGIAFWSPFDQERYFLPWRVIEVSPIGLREFLSIRGFSVLASEARWIWLPALLVGLMLLGVRRVVQRCGRDHA